jgi:DNA-binding protein Fis
MAGCGCKKQNNEQSQQTQQTQQQQANETVKDSVKKIVEKYYNKK